MSWDWGSSPDRCAYQVGTVSYWQLCPCLLNSFLERTVHIHWDHTLRSRPSPACCSPVPSLLLLHLTAATALCTPPALASWSVHSPRFSPHPGLRPLFPAPEYPHSLGSGLSPQLLSLCCWGCVEAAVSGGGELGLVAELLGFHPRLHLPAFQLLLHLSAWVSSFVRMGWLWGLGQRGGPAWARTSLVALRSQHLSTRNTWPREHVLNGYFSLIKLWRGRSHSSHSSDDEPETQNRSLTEPHD